MIDPDQQRFARTGHNAMRGALPDRYRDAGDQTCGRCGMSVGAVCNRNVMVAATSTTAVAAAQCMERFDERILVVIDERTDRHRTVGIVTDRELAGVIARGADPARVTLREIMRADPGFVADTADVFETAWWMRRNGLREAIVHDEAGRLTGVVTLDQLLEKLTEEIVGSAALSPDERSCPLRSKALH
jgi:signal-transduction protein with cAMP-binding, CBS, and nucleotidyltransferase domain